MQRKVLFIGFALITLIATTIAITQLFSPEAEAQRNSSVRFEYALINGTYVPYPADNASSVSSAVNICYLQQTGCQNEEVRFDINISKFLQDERLENLPNAKVRAGHRAQDFAFSKAISKLGSDGWEMIDSPAEEFDLYYTNQEGVRTLREAAQTDRQHTWFKRIRQ